MSNHLTPTQLASETGWNRQDVIDTCLQLGVPIYEGKIDKTLFAASVKGAGRPEVAGPTG